MKEVLKKYLDEFKSGTKLMFKEFFNKETNKKQRANMWTFSRLVISFLIPICSLISVLTANIGLFIASIGLTGFGALTDFFDGRSARKHNSFSEYGKLLDQVADKVFSGMVGINLALFNPMFLVALLGESIIAGINVIYKVQHPNLDIKSTQIGRSKQWPLCLSLVSGIFSANDPLLSIVTNILIMITVLFQVATALSYIKTNNENVKKIKNENNDNLIEIEDNYEKSNGKENNKSIEKTVTKNNISKKEELIKLRNELIEILDLKDSDNIDIEDNYQKTKK